MKKAPAPQINYPRLCSAIAKSRLVLQHHREQRRMMVSQYVGSHWSEESGRTKVVPVNLISLYTSIVQRSLIAKNPRVMLSTNNRNAKPTVAAMETWANRTIDKMYLANTLQRVVLDALFSIGILKVALATPSQTALTGYATAPGKPFAERVDLDDFVFDVHARDFRECGFIGHRYRVPLDSIRDSSLYSKARKDLTPSRDPTYNEQGDERISVLGRGYYSNLEEFEDMVDLWEIYLPRSRRVLTLASNDGAGPMEDEEPLREVEWLGPDCGPYHLLGYEVVPGNAMPKGPIQTLIDLHEAVNRIYRKLVRQSDRQKAQLAYRSSSTETAKRAMETGDGEAFSCDDPTALQTLEWGGPNAQNIAFGNHLKELFGWLAGNLDMMGGLSPQSKTLGQDKLLAENASAGIGDKQETTVRFVSSAVEALCWYWWHDPQTVMQANYQVPGMPELSHNRRVTPQQRQKASFEDLDIRVDPYSLRHQTPQQRVNDLTQLVQSVIIPMMPILQQQGIAFDLSAYLKKMAKYMDSPDLEEIVSIQTPPDPESGGSDTPKTMPQETTRNYVRRSQGGMNSPDAQKAEMMNELLAKPSQPSQNGQKMGAR